MKMLDKVEALSARIPDMIIERMVLHSLDTLQQEHAMHEIKTAGDSPYIITLLAGSAADLNGVLAAPEGEFDFKLEAHSRLSPPGEPNEIGVLATLMMLLEYGRYPVCISFGFAAMQSTHALKEQPAAKGVSFLTEADMENYELEGISNVLAVQACTPCGRFTVATKQTERSLGATGYSYGEPEVLHLDADGAVFSYDIAFFYTAYSAAWDLIEQGHPISPQDAAYKGIEAAHELLGDQWIEEK